MNRTAKQPETAQKPAGGKNPAAANKTSTRPQDENPRNKAAQQDMGKRESAGAVWVRVKDTMGRVYFYHSVTREVSWVLPKGALAVTMAELETRIQQRMAANNRVVKEHDAPTLTVEDVIDE